MNRKELYAQVTSLNLQEEVKATYGKNYTQCSNAELKIVVDAATAGLEEALTPGVERSLNKLVEILQKKKILLNSEVCAIMNA